MLAILGAVAEFENDTRREWQRDGIERAKERGFYRGRPFSIDSREIETLACSALKSAAIARSLGISRERLPTASAE
jgi:DNA invertase Pin-like site-specific DNA recombinase